MHARTWKRIQHQLRHTWARNGRFESNVTSEHTLVNSVTTPALKFANEHLRKSTPPFNQKRINPCIYQRCHEGTWKHDASLAGLREGRTGPHTRESPPAFSFSPLPSFPLASTQVESNQSGGLSNFQTFNGRWRPLSANYDL